MRCCSLIILLLYGFKKGYKWGHGFVFWSSRIEDFFELVWKRSPFLEDFLGILEIWELYRLVKMVFVFKNTFLAIIWLKKVVGTILFYTKKEDRGSPTRTKTFHEILFIKKIYNKVINYLIILSYSYSIIYFHCS